MKTMTVVAVAMMGMFLYGATSNLSVPGKSGAAITHLIPPDCHPLGPDTIECCYPEGCGITGS